MVARGWKTATILAVAAAGWAVAAQAQKPPASGGDDSSRIISVANDDAEMNAAIARARRELPDFYAHMARPGSGERRFMIKFDILPGEGAEYVWAGELDRTTVPMTGILVNQPQRSSEQLGQRVPIPEARIIDWGYLRDEVAQGYHTQRVLLDRMPAEEAAELRRRMGW